jgi:hypothetical protein
MTGSEPVGQASIELSTEVPDNLPDEAKSRVYLLLNREAERIAQIAAVADRDREVNRREAERIRALPKDRPSIVIAVGTKDPEAVVVVRGTYQVGGKKLTAKENR